MKSIRPYKVGNSPKAIAGVAPAATAVVGASVARKSAAGKWAMAALSVLVATVFVFVTLADSEAARKKRKKYTKKKRKPAPKLVIQTPHQRLAYAITLAHRAKFDQARAEAKKCGLPHAAKLIEWLKLRHSSSPVTADEITRFLKDNPGWPSRKRLATRAEAAHFFRPKSPQDTIAYFKDNPPKTGAGFAALARAHFRAGDKKTARMWLARAWHGSALGKGLEKFILGSPVGKLLTRRDHLARAAYFAFRHQPKELMRIKHRYKGGDRKLIVATASLLFKSKRANGRLAAVPGSLRGNPALNYALARYWRHKDKPQRVRNTVLAASFRKTPLNHPRGWWRERHAQARAALGKANYPLAYVLSAPHGLRQGHRFAQAEFFSGWIALVHLKRPRLALKHFEALRKGVSHPRSIARAEYWIGRAHERIGNVETARKHFAHAANYPRSFYGLLGLDRLDPDELARRNLNAELKPAPKPAIDTAFKEKFNGRDVVQLVRALVKAKKKGLAARFLFALSKDADDAQEYAATAALAHEASLPHVGVRIAKHAEARGHIMGPLAYPHNVLPRFVKLSDSVEKPLLLGLIRQESEFNPRAKSHAGARGLMQLMPGTARLVARQYKQRYRKNKLTEDPAYNLKLGAAHLHDLINNHGGSYILALVSYNAGPARTLAWVKQFGDPRRSRVDPINWIESIPFDETRDYVQKVMENLQIYRARFDMAEDTSLTDALSRGTPPALRRGDRKGAQPTARDYKKPVKPKIKPARS